MENKGQIYATDRDGRRLAPIFDRLDPRQCRATSRCVRPRGEQDVLADLAGRCDLVFVDAPCTGTGTWRRNPDAKWRLRPGALEQRQQGAGRGAVGRRSAFLKPGGRLLYVTCSVLREENEDRIEAPAGPGAPTSCRSGRHTWPNAAGLPELAERASRFGPGLRLTPRTTGPTGSTSRRCRGSAQALSPDAGRARLSASGSLRGTARASGCRSRRSACRRCGPVGGTAAGWSRCRR